MKRSKEKSSRSQQRENSTHHILGRKPVLEILKIAPHRIKTLILSSQSYDWLQRHYESFTTLSIPIDRIDEAEFERRFPRDELHQGCIASVSEPIISSLGDLLLKMKQREGRALILVPAGLTDPRNLGAVLRCAECFGADGVLLPSHRSVGITPIVTKTSAGASELVPLYEITNVAKALQTLTEVGFWSVAAAVADDAAGLSEFTFPERTVLVVGAEGSGVPKLVAEKSDFRVKIPMSGHIDSLNVAQATAVLLYQYRVQWPSDQ